MIWFKVMLRKIAMAALMLCAIVGAYVSAGGMDLLFPAAGFPIVLMGMVMVSAEFIIAGWLASRWHEIFWLQRLLLIGFVLILMSISALSLYAELATRAGHHGEIVTATATPPIQHVAALLGIQISTAEVVRTLIAAMVLCCNPLAVVLAAVLAAPRRTAA